MTINKYLQMSVETTRKFLGGFDFAPICKEIKERYIMQTTTMGRKKTNAVNSNLITKLGTCAVFLFKK